MDKEITSFREKRANARKEHDDRQQTLRANHIGRLDGIKAQIGVLDDFYEDSVNKRNINALTVLNIRDYLR